MECRNSTMSAKNVDTTFVATVHFGWLLRDFFTALIPSVSYRSECLCIMTSHQVIRGRSCLREIQLP